MKEFNYEKNFITIYKKLINNPEKFPFVIVKNRGNVPISQENSTDNTNTDLVGQQGEGVNPNTLKDELKGYFVQNMVNMKAYYDILQSKMIANAIMKNDLQNRQYQYADMQNRQYPCMPFAPAQFMPQVVNVVNDQQSEYMNMMAFLYLKNIQSQQMSRSNL